MNSHVFGLIFNWNSSLRLPWDLSLVLLNVSTKMMGCFLSFPHPRLHLCYISDFVINTKHGNIHPGHSTSVNMNVDHITKNKLWTLHVWEGRSLYVCFISLCNPVVLVKHVTPVMRCVLCWGMTVSPCSGFRTWLCDCMLVCSMADSECPLMWKKKRRHFSVFKWSSLTHTRLEGHNQQTDQSIKENLFLRCFCRSLSDSWWASAQVSRLTGAGKHPSVELLRF